MSAQRIRLMDPGLASKIAAGEVVERPSSVVKELVENSLDAGASSITVYLEDGGKRLIRVVDDGSGIARDDAPLVFVRHSTSKVSAEDDLLRIATLGFRGEALASVASVARVTLKSRPGDAIEGVSVTVEGADVPEVMEAGCPKGTTVEVRDLFYNTPARQKFLRTRESELSRVVEVMKSTALSNPGVRFRLFHGKTRVLDTPGGGLKDRISDLFGAGVADKLVEVSTPAVNGYVGRPEVTYSTTRGVFTSVNGRPVRDRAINRALMDGFGSLLERSRYPFAALDVKIDPGEVDVNIHPAKNEVRFRGQRLVFDAVKTAVKTALSRALTVTAASGAGTETEDGGGFHKARRKETARFTGFGGAGGVEDTEPGGPPDTGNTENIENIERAAEAEGLYSARGEEAPSPEFLDLQVVGSLWGEFLVAEDPEREVFYMIDQHAAAERCAFERLKSEYYSRGVTSQMLLLPERVELATDEAEAVREAEGELRAMGFELEGFGPSGAAGGEAFLVRSVPEALKAKRAEPLIRDFAGEYASTGGSSAVESLVEGFLMRIACHGVIRGTRPLTGEEGRALLKDLAGVDFSAHCPHGRPVAKRFTRKEVEGMFGRRG